MAPINGGNEGELMRFFFSSGGSFGATGEAVRGRRRRRRARPASVREEEEEARGLGRPKGLVGWLAAWAGRGWLGPAGRPRPGRGKQAGWAEKGCRAAGSAGPKVKKENQRISELKSDF
jgi:hypothetical protein